MQTQSTVADWGGIVSTSERVGWRLDDVLPPEARFDFERPFLPEGLARTGGLSQLDPREQRVLNQIRAHGYLAIFGLVEEFILPFVVEHLSRRVEAPLDEQRALLAFAQEEAKHIELFRRFRRRFVEGFGTPLEVIGPPRAVADHVLSRHPLGVGLLILHIEWMTQRHYTTMVRDRGELEPLFAGLLHSHWLEECQHARMDGWIVERAADAASAADRRQGVSDYLELVRYFDVALGQQAELDRVGLERAIGRALPPDDRAAIQRAQHASMREAFLCAGLTHPRLVAALERVGDGTGATDAAYRLCLELC